MQSTNLVPICTASSRVWRRRISARAIGKTFMYTARGGELFGASPSAKASSLQPLYVYTSSESFVQQVTAKCKRISQTFVHVADRFRCNSFSFRRKWLCLNVHTIPYIGLYIAGKPFCRCVRMSRATQYFLQLKSSIQNRRQYIARNGRSRNEKML